MVSPTSLPAMVSPTTSLSAMISSTSLPALISTSPPAMIFSTALPAHCDPTTPFLVHLSAWFNTCIPTPLALLSTVCGSLSILSWLFAQLPQIYKNYKLRSTAGLSIFFLVEWLLGDVTNLLGCLTTQQATWQVVIAGYYTFVDVCLCAQFAWYSRSSSGESWTDSSTGSSVGSRDTDSDSVIGGLSPINSLFREEMTEERSTVAEDGEGIKDKSGPTFRQVSYEKHAARPFWRAMPSPRTVLVAGMVGQAHAAPMLAGSQEGLGLAWAGRILSWSSTLLYLGSRLPQLFKNWRRKSTAGLSPLLFLAAFCGNLFYSLSIVTNPNAWGDFDAFGGHGWAGADGSDREEWILRAVPFFLGAAGVLCMDAMMGVQFMLYSEREEELVKVRDSSGHGHWELVSGWMRGWVPHLTSRVKVVDLAESQRLLAESREIDRFSRHYDAVSRT